MSLLSEALSDLEARGALDRVTQLEVTADRASVVMMPKIAVTRPQKKLPGEDPDDVLFDAS